MRGRGEGEGRRREGKRGMLVDANVVLNCRDTFDLDDDALLKQLANGVQS